MFKLHSSLHRENGTAVNTHLYLGSVAGRAGPAWLVLIIFVLSLANAIAQDDASAPPSDYLISPGDQISIFVYGESELSFNSLPIPNDGMITFPFIGEVQVAGRHESQVAGDIADRLRDGYLLQPQVTVTVSGYRPIYVGGGVDQPGKKSFDVGMDVKRVITLSGGFSDNADRDSLLIQRTGAAGRQELEVTLSTPVLPGDILTVGTKEVEEKAKQYFYLYGEVAKPGQYEYRNGLSVEKAIAIAGGFGHRASKRKITITRGEPAEKMKKVPLGAPVEPGDIITIGASLF